MRSNPEPDIPELDLRDRFALSFDRDLGGSVPKHIGVAVSGGGDSVALLLLLDAWAQDDKTRITAITVDHGLREISAQEAADVGRICAGLGLPHTVLKWIGWDGKGNLQQAARDARYGLMAKWAKSVGVTDIALGHTCDDQAETFLMRLARGSGVDGLSSMSRFRDNLGVRWLRPILALRRTELRQFLKSAGVPWADDPSNDDEKYERVRVRKTLELLEPLGIDAENLSATAGRLGAVRHVLSRTTADAAKGISTIKAGAVFLETSQFLALAAETRRRLLSHALCWVSGNAYPPRAGALGELMGRLEAGESGTLHGCLIVWNKDQIVVARECNALTDLKGEPGEVWDGKWRVNGPNKGGCTIQVTGENGLKPCPNWRETGLPRSVLLAAPSVWQGGEIIAAPVAGWANGWHAEMLQDENDFITAILSH